MKHLFFLLLLTVACTPKQQVGKSANAVKKEDIQALSETEYKLFIDDLNPYLKEYQEFFARQLKRYGTNTEGEPLVNFTELQAFASSNSFLGIARFMEEAFSTNTPAWATNAGAVGETQDSCTVGFSSEFFPKTQVLSERTLKRYVDYCMGSSPTYALDFALLAKWHISNIIRLAEMGADVTNVTNKLGGVIEPYFHMYGKDLALFKYFHEERKVPLPSNVLWGAFRAERQDLFDYCLQQRANIHHIDSYTSSSIFYFFDDDEQWPMVKTLLQKGIDPNLPDADGVTAFVHLLSINKLSTAQKLLEYTDTNILPPGQTNLMEAALWTQIFYYGYEDAGLSPEVVQFISDLSTGK